MSAPNLARGSVRRLVLDIGPLAAVYLVFQSAIILFLDFLWAGHPPGNPLLMPGALLALNGSMITAKVPLWRMLPVTARDIDRARWWHGVGGPGLLLSFFLAVPVVARMALGRGHPPWSAVGWILGGQFAACVALAVVLTVMPLLRRKWGSWNMPIVLPAALAYFRLMMPAHGDLRPSLEIIIPAAILAAAALYLTAGRWPLPLTAAMWASPSGRELHGDTDVSSLSGWPVLLLANLRVWLWLWGIMAFVCLVLKYFLPDFNLGLFGWMLGLMSAQFAVVNLAMGMRSFRALPLSGARLTFILVLLLLALQTVSLALFALVLRILGNALPATAFIAPLIYPLFYFSATLRYGMRMAQFGYALSILVIVPLTLLSRGAGERWTIAGLGVLALLAVFWTWHEIARGSRAYRVQPLVPTRWRGA